MSFAEFYNATSGLGDAFTEARDRREAQKLYGDWLTSAVSGQGHTTPLAALGQSAGAPVGQALSQLGQSSLPTFASTGGAIGDYLAQTRARESGGNDLAANPNSTAKGRYQFTDDTWRNVAKAHPDLGLQPGGWRDPGQQEKAMQAFTADNAKALTSAGIPINPANLYGAHFLGAGGASKFIPAAINNPDAPATAFVSPGAAAANRSVFYNKDGSPKSAGQVYAWLGGQRGGSQEASVPLASRQVRVASAGSQTMQMPQTASAESTGDPDAPASGAVPVGFRIPGQSQGGDFVPGTEASPALSTGGVPQGGASLAPAAAQRITPQQAQTLRAMLANPLTQGHAAKIIEGLNKPDEFSFQVVGDQLVRTSKSGRAEVVPNITKPPTFQTVKGSDGNDYTFNPQTGGWTRAIEGKPTEFQDLVTPQERQAAGVDPSYKGPVQRGPNGELRLPGKATTEVVMPAAEKAQDVKIGTAYGEAFNDFQQQGRNAAGQLNTFRLMEKLVDNPDFYSGTAAGPILAARRAAAALGIQGIESAAPNELFAKLANQSIIDKLGGSLGAGVSNSDVLTMQRTVANMENTPEGNRRVLQFSKALAQRQIDVAKLARQYAGAHGGRLDAGFDDQLASWAEAHPLIPEETKAQIEKSRAVAQPQQPQAQPVPEQRVAQPQQQRQAPQPGMVSKGYRFIGGDPANPASWERVGAPQGGGPIL